MTSRYCYELHFQEETGLDGDLCEQVGGAFKQTISRGDSPGLTTLSVAPPEHVRRQSPVGRWDLHFKITCVTSNISVIYLEKPLFII